MQNDKWVALALRDDVFMTRDLYNKKRLFRPGSFRMLR